MALVIFIPPVTAAFGLVKLSNEMYLIALALALVPILVLEMAKATGLVRHQYQ
jgi:Ca2+-transporting ATPase